LYFYGVKYPELEKQGAISMSDYKVCAVILMAFLANFSLSSMACALVCSVHGFC